MTNPFEDPAARYLVLVNDEGQHSLWPVDIAVPAGWTAVHGPDSRESCLAVVSARWTDLRPASLVRSLQQQDPDPGPEVRPPAGSSPAAGGP